MKEVPTLLGIEGVRIFKGNRFDDERGSFEEMFHVEQFKEMGLPTEWPQDNLSTSWKGTLRGMHIQSKNPQGKLIRCTYGTIYDAFLDLRPESKTFRECRGLFLSWEVPMTVYIPPGCAHGFFCMSPIALVHYKCTTVYDRESDGGVHWQKSGIDWPIDSTFEPMVSMKDQLLPSLDDYIKALG